MEAKLVVVGGGTSSRQYELHLPAIIGRSRSSDVVLGHPLVSRQHCELFEARGMLMVRDLGSLNGTYVGDARIGEHAVPIKPGDLLTVGPLTFRAVYRAAAQNKASTWNDDGPTLDAAVLDRGDEFRDTPAPPLASESGPGDTLPPPNAM